MSLLPILSGAATLFGGMFGGSSQSDPKFMMSPEQRAAYDQLMSYSKTGNLAGVTGYNAGEAYRGRLGDYGMTGLESAGQGKLMGLVNSSLPQVYNMGVDQLSQLLGGSKFDPYSDQGVYGGFKKNVMKELGESKDRLRRDSAVTGSLYSSNFGNQSRKLEENATDTLTGKLAELYDTYAQRQINAIPLASSMAQQGENMQMNRIAASQQYGSLQRMLNDQALKDKYADYQRTRGEYQNKIQSILSSLQSAGGIGTWTQGQTSSNGLANMLGNVGANIFGQAAGKKLTTGKWD